MLGINTYLKPLKLLQLSFSKRATETSAVNVVTSDLKIQLNKLKVIRIMLSAACLWALLIS